MSTTRWLLLFSLLFAASGCTFTTLWVVPKTISEDGEVWGTTTFGGIGRMRLKSADTVRISLRPRSTMCGVESYCTLQGKLVRLELSAEGEVVALVVTPTTVFTETETPRGGSTRIMLPMPPGLVRVPVGDIHALGQRRCNNCFQVG
jgi:hypothetical protein